MTHQTFVSLRSRTDGPGLEGQGRMLKKKNQKLCCARYLRISYGRELALLECQSVLAQDDPSDSSRLRAVSKQ